MIEKHNAIGQQDSDDVIFVLDHVGFGTVLAVFCNGFDLVASALQTWGNPPDSVVRDWQRQLTTFSVSARHCSTAETLVTKNGILIPLINLIESLETDCKPILAGYGKSPRPIPFVTLAPTWPSGIVPLSDAAPIESHTFGVAASQWVSE